MDVKGRQQKGILVVFSGFSGSGKGTVMNRLMERYGAYYALSISATTRKPREGEQDGREYFFKTKEEFEKMIENQELVEYALYVGNYYGTPKAYVQEQLDAGKDVILEIEIQGARSIKAMFPDTLLLFVAPPDADTLKKRLSGRGTESKEAVAARLARAYEEAQGVEEYDYLVINDALEECVDAVHATIRNEHAKVSRNQAYIGKIKEELKRFSKGE